MGNLKLQRVTGSPAVIHLGYQGILLLQIMSILYFNPESYAIHLDYQGILLLEIMSFL